MLEMNDKLTILCANQTPTDQHETQKQNGTGNKMTNQGVTTIAKK